MINEKEYISVRHWIDEEKIKNEKGERIEFDNHPFLEDIYTDQSQKMTVMKAAQVGMTTCEMLKNHFDAKKYKIDLIYTLPTDSDVRVMVGGKTNRIIANNPCMLEDVADKDSVEQKQVGGSMIYFRGTWTKKSAMMTPADRVVHDEKDACFEPNTEILTRKGWKKIQNVVLDDKICTLNQKDRRVVFQNPTEVQNVNYNGNLYRFTANQLDITVTKNHRMWARTRSHSGFQGAMNPYTLHKAPTLVGKSFVVSSSGRWLRFSKKDKVSIPRVKTTRMTKQKKSVPLNYPPKSFPALPFYRFMGWYITEGSTKKKRNYQGKRYSSGAICITQKKRKEIDDIVKCVKDLGYSPNIYKNKRGISNIVFNDRQLAFLLQKLGNSSQKYLPQYLMYGKKEWLEQFLESSILGDGDDRNVITTQSKKLADQYQVIALQLGKTASIYYEPKSKVYRVGIIQKPYRRFGGFRNSNSRGLVSVENYRGKVYCVTTPNGVVMVRGNKAKLPIWSGNSKLDVIADYQARLQHSKYKQTHTFSHPSLPETGVHADWLKSDQKHWFVQCPSCKFWQYLSWNTEDPRKMSIDIDKKIFICKKCHKKLPDYVRREGQWVAKYPNREWSGYWVPLLICPWVSAKDIVEKYQQPDTTDEFFYTKILGLPHADASSKLLRNSFFQNLTGKRWAPDTTERIVMGVDTGLRLDYVLGNVNGLFHHSDCKDYSELDDIMRRWPKCIAVIDQGGDLIGSRQFYEKWSGRVFLCMLAGDRKTKELTKWGSKDEQGAVTADRNRMIQLVVDEFRKKRIPVHGTEQDWFEYWLDWNNLSKNKVLDPETGEIKGYKWIRSGRDHRCFVAGTQILTSKGNKNIEDIEVGDKVLTRQGLRKVTWTDTSVAEVISTGILVGTEDHPVWTDNAGFKDLLAMDYYDRVRVCQPRRLFIKVLSFVDTLIQRAEQSEFIMSQTDEKRRGVSAGCMRKFIKLTLGIFLKVLLYTTKIIIRLIIHQKTWKQCLTKNIPSCICVNGTKIQKIRKKLLSTLNQLDHLVLSVWRSGEKLKRVRQYYEQMPMLLNVLPVLSAAKAQKQYQEMAVNFVDQNADQNTIQESGEINIPVTKKIEQKRVYNFEVEDAHEYFANGVLVSNCLATVFWRVGMSRFAGMGSIIEEPTELKPNSYEIDPNNTASFNPEKLFDLMENQEDNDWRIV